MKLNFTICLLNNTDSESTTLLHAFFMSKADTFTKNTMPMSLKFRHNSCNLQTLSSKQHIATVITKQTSHVSIEDCAFRH